MKNLSDSLSAAGQVLPDEEFILYILGGLGPEYDSVVVNLTSHSNSFSLQEVQYMLQSHEIKLEQLNSAATLDITIPSTNYASHFKKHPNSTYSPPGHPSQSSHRGGQGGRRGRGDTNRPICQLCGRQGHIALRCYHRFDISFQGAQASSQSPSLNTNNN
ncbi:Zinc finger, CCHC-type [Trema orientale]|uniref:Zinc finger, CCHC-type n=1 Tax=Trema orientale TaxID=63057 RepID=A0A2P5G1F0_TREOI|nr:Zinc finger, CCHC-type [Trema orientale]